MERTMGLGYLWVPTMIGMRANFVMINTINMASVSTPMEICTLGNSTKVAILFYQSIYLSINQSNNDKPLNDIDSIIGERHGQGAYSYANGNQYQGGFRFGQCHGQGELR